MLPGDAVFQCRQHGTAVGQAGELVDEGSTAQLGNQIHDVGIERDVVAENVQQRLVRSDVLCVMQQSDQGLLLVCPKMAGDGVFPDDVVTLAGALGNQLDGGGIGDFAQQATVRSGVAPQAGQQPELVKAGCLR